MPMSLRNAAPPPTRMATSSTSSGSLAGDRLGLQHPQRRVGPAGRRARRPHRRPASTRHRRGPCIAATCWRDDGLVGERLVEVLEPGRGDVADHLGDRGVHQPEAARRVQDLEHGQHDAERDVEPGPVVAERAPTPGRRRPTPCTGLEALPRRPSPSNGAPTFKPVGVGGHQPQRRARRRRSSAGWSTRTSRPRRPRSPSSSIASSTTSSPSAVAVPSGAQNWLRDPVSENASVDRCRPDGDRPADVVGAVRPRSPRRRE